MIWYGIRKNNQPSETRVMRCWRGYTSAVQPTTLKALKETETTNTIKDNHALASCVHDLPGNSQCKGHCTLYTGSPLFVPLFIVLVNSLFFLSSLLLLPAGLWHFKTCVSTGDSLGEEPWWYVYTAEWCGCILTVSHITYLPGWFPVAFLRISSSSVLLW